MATIINHRSSLATDPIRNFRFLVKFTPIGGATSSPATLALGTATAGNAAAHFGFTSVSGMSVTTDSIPYREGGYNTTVHQIPGQTSFTPINLQRGVILNTNHAWEWMKDLFVTVQGGAKNNLTTNFRCDVEISVLSHPIPGSAGSDDLNPSVTAGDDHVAMRFKVYNAWITSVAYSDLNAGDNALFVEQMVLVHEGFDLNWAPSLTESAPEFN